MVNMPQQESQGPRSGDELAPIATVCLFENGVVRLWKQFIKPNERIGVHEHKHNYWLLEVSTGSHIIGAGFPKGKANEERSFRIEAKRGQGYFVSAGHIEDAATPADSVGAYDAYVLELLKPNPGFSSSPASSSSLWFENDDVCLSACCPNSPASVASFDCFVLQLSGHKETGVHPAQPFHKYLEKGARLPAVASDEDVLVLQLKGADSRL